MSADTTTVQEWQELAWHLAARDLTADVEPDSPEWTQWAENIWGEEARMLLSAFDKITQMRARVTETEVDYAGAALAAYTRPYQGPDGNWWYRRPNPTTGEMRPHGPFYTRDEALTEQDQDATS